MRVQRHFKTEYLFTIQSTCVIFRVAYLLTYNSNVGPLIKIVSKMVGDFFNFSVIYIIMMLMFAIVGNMNYVLYLNEYHDLFDSLLTVFNSSVGLFSFNHFHKIPNAEMNTVGIVFTGCIVLIFMVLFLNLLVSILANTYEIFNSNSNGLYLSKILLSRDEMSYDVSFGAFLSSIPPLNLIQIPFIPIAVVLKPKQQLMITINNLVMRI